MEELLENRDFLGNLMINVRDPISRQELFEEVRDIEEELYLDYQIYPIFTGFGWKPPGPHRAYKRQPRVPVRYTFEPTLSAIPEQRAVRFTKKSKKSKKSKPKKSRWTRLSRKSGRSRNRK